MHAPAMPPRPSGIALTAAVSAAVALPTALAYNQPPSPTALNQATAIGAWGVVMLLMPARGFITEAAARAAPALVALACVMLAACASAVWGPLPLTLALPAAACLALAALVLTAGAATTPSRSLWQAFFVSWVVAGAISTAVGIVQVFAPEAADGSWIALAASPGRAIGNLRQPNHLSTLLVWSAAAAIALVDLRPTRRRAWLLGAVYAALLFGVTLSGSRTGLMSVVLLATWGLLDRRLSRPARAWLLASPLLCAASWLLLDQLAPSSGAAARASGGDISSSRFAIWRETWHLITGQPWLGVGFGNFNLAWSLSPMPDRPPHFFDHTHNLPLQLIVELGVPLGLFVVGLLVWTLWRAHRRNSNSAGWEGAARRAVFMMLLVVALHSLVEYPLWYAYFLLPTAFAWGLCLARTDAMVRASTTAARTVFVGLVMVASATVMVWDYQRVAAIFMPPNDSAPVLAERIAAGRRSFFFAHHADYARATTAAHPGEVMDSFDVAKYHLLDTRLMLAWAKAYAERGDLDRARYIADRLREFRNPRSHDFFAACDGDPRPRPFQCDPPSRALTWRDFTGKQ